jgi:TolB-like protein/class 3 adenylate cyclase
LATGRVERRLAAILAADVAGYSRLMGSDEEGTHERLKAHLRELIEPKIAEHRGRIVKNTGDGLLAEFASVVDAVRCGVEIQRGMAEREPEVTDERRIRFRIGVNLGDVIAEEHDIFGDGVNIAARLEALAEPGGICVSRVVRDQVRDKLDYSFEDRGEQSVKNIGRPVRVYVLRPDAVAGRQSSRPPLAAPISQSAGAPPLSIVVLPFANLSSDAEQGYFADGITEDLTTDLSRLAEMFVISRSTAFTYRGKSVGAKQIGRELGIHYVLEGSVRLSGNRVRVNAQLIDAETEAHLWAERFDGTTTDLFALQDEITRRIAVALNLELIGAEVARRAGDPQALDYILRGRNSVELKPPSPDNFAEAIGFFERALALDPTSVEAASYLAGALAGRVLDGMTSSAGVDVDRAEGLVRRVASYGVGFHSYTEPMLSTDNEMVRDIVLAVMASLAKIERQKISERTRAGMQRAADQGKLLGRPRISPAKRAEIVEMLTKGDGIRATARAVGTGNETVHRIAREMRAGVAA